MTYILDAEFSPEDDNDDSSVSKKQRVRDKIQRDVDAFLAKGGVIREVEAIPYDHLKNDFEQIQKAEK
jgi:hypothetical protein